MTEKFLRLLNPIKEPYCKVIILGEEEQSFLVELLNTFKQENETSLGLNPNDTMILNCLCDKIN